MTKIGVPVSIVSIFVICFMCANVFSIIFSYFSIKTKCYSKISALMLNGFESKVVSIFPPDHRSTVHTFCGLLGCK